MTAAAPRAWALRGLFALALVFAVREARPLLAPMLIAVVLTFVLAPGVRWMRRRGVHEMLGALVMVTALLATTVPLALVLAGPAAAWWEAAPQTLARVIARVEAWRAGWTAGAQVATPAPPSSAAPTPDPITERLASEGFAMTGAVLGGGASFLLSATATVILLFFLLASEHWMLSRVVEALPRWRTRALVLSGVRAAQREIGRYLMAVALINTTAGAVTGAGLWLIGLPNPLLWGVLVAVLCFVPYLGPMLLMGLLALAGVMAFDTPGRMLAPMVLFMAVHAVEANLLSPWFVGRRLALSPISVIVSVMFWGWLWGIAGAVIAVPVLIALRNVCHRSRGLRLLRRFLEGDLRKVPSIRSLMRRPLRWPASAASGVPGASRLVRPPPAPAARWSEAEHVAQAGRVDAAPIVAGERQLVTRPLEHDA